MYPALIDCDVHEDITAQDALLEYMSEEWREFLALDDYGAEDFLMFATDYPHWDADVPMRTLSAMPSRWREKVAYGNAAELYGLKVLAPA